MAFVEVERLVTDLLGTGTMREDTTSELHRFLAEARAGQLHPDDLSYLRGLHSRLSGAKPNGNAGTNSKPEAQPQTDPLGNALRELNEARNKIAMLQQKVAAAQGTFSSLEQQLASRADGGGDDRKFRDIKKRFARRYHPNSVNSTGIDKIIRTEIFKEFWAEIEDVEKS